MNTQEMYLWLHATDAFLRDPESPLSSLASPFPGGASSSASLKQQKSVPLPQVTSRAVKTLDHV